MANKKNVKKTTDLNYDSRFNFKKYSNNKKLDGLSFTSKLDYSKEFHDKLEQFKNIKPSNKKPEQRIFLYDYVSDLYNSLLSDYEQQYSNYSNEKRRVSVLNTILVIS